MSFLYDQKNLLFEKKFKYGEFFP